MIQETEDDDPAAALRLRAEQHLRAQGRARETPHPQQMEQIIYELRVHQIELEMQNDELRRTQAALEASRARYHALYDLAPVGYLTLSEDGRILKANRLAAELLGQPPAALFKQPLSRFILAEDQDAYYLHSKQLLKSGAPQATELRLHGAPPRWIRLIETSPPGADDPLVRRAVLSDISEAKEAQARAEAATRAKSDFLSSMSHELRTPMNGIMGMADLLRETDLNQEQQGYAETICSSAHALLAIINDILDFSKIEAGKVSLEALPLDLHRAMEEVVELLKVPAQRLGLRLLLRYDPAAPRQLLGDIGRVRQIVLNLLSNAIKFTPHGHVLLHVEGGAAAAGLAALRVTVQDTGIGIPAEQQALLFQRFQQGDTTTTRKYGGTGLGLAISRQLAALMGGTLRVVSQAGAGAAFTLEVTLPLDGAAAPEPPAAETLRGVRALVVDALPSGHEITTRQCARWGMRAEGVTSTEEAARWILTARALRDPYQVVCVDLASLGIDAQQAAAAFGNTRLILFTIAAGQRPLNPMHHACLARPAREALLYTTLLRLLGCPRTSLPPQPPAASPFAGARVLLVEDNPVNQRVGVALLTRLGCLVDVADHGQAGCALAAQSSYALILMDCQMPLMDGYDATLTIRRAEGAGRRTPVIAMTADATPENQQRCSAAGMDDHLTKPVTLAALRAMLERWASHPLEGFLKHPPTEI